MEKVELFGAGENSGGVTIGQVDLGPLWLFVGLTLLLVLILAVFQLLNSRRTKSSDPDVASLLSDLRKEMNQQNDAVEQKIKKVSDQMKNLEGVMDELATTKELFQKALTAAKDHIDALEAAAKLHDSKILAIGDQLPTLRENIGGLRNQVAAFEQRAKEAETARTDAEAARATAERERDAANESAGIEVVPTTDEQYRELHQRLLEDAELLAAEAASGPVFQFFTEVKSILQSTDQHVQSLAADRLDDRSAYQSLLPNKLDPTLMPFERQSEAFTMKRRLEAIRTYLTAQLKDKGYQILLPVVNSERFSSERHNKDGEVATSNPGLYGMVAAVNAPGWINGNRVGQKAFVTVYVQGTLTPPTTPAAVSAPPAPVVVPVESPSTEEETPQAPVPTAEVKPKAQESLPFSEVPKAQVSDTAETSNEDLTRE